MTCCHHQEDEQKKSENKADKNHSKHRKSDFIEQSEKDLYLLKKVCGHPVACQNKFISDDTCNRIDRTLLLGAGAEPGIFDLSAIRIVEVKSVDRIRRNHDIDILRE